MILVFFSEDDLSDNINSRDIFQYYCKVLKLHQSAFWDTLHIQGGPEKTERDTSHNMWVQ